MLQTPAAPEVRSIVTLVLLFEFQIVFLSHCNPLLYSGVQCFGWWLIIVENNQKHYLNDDIGTDVDFMSDTLQ